MAFSELLGMSIVGLIVVYILWSFGKSAAVSQTSLITDVGNAVLGYSGRTFSGFGSFASRVLPGSSGHQEAAIVAPKTRKRKSGLRQE